MVNITRVRIFTQLNYQNGCVDNAREMLSVSLPLNIVHLTSVLYSVS